MLFRVSYRWSKKPFSNIRQIVENFYYGIQNIILWTPIIWNDSDWDWAFLAKIMQFKISNMAKHIGESDRHINSQSTVRQLRSCVYLLKRLDEDNYFKNAGYNPKTWKDLSQKECERIAYHSNMMQKQDQRYLGQIIGKYLTHWWD